MKNNNKNRAKNSFPALPIEGLAGVSFKPQHLTDILADYQKNVFFEIHAENYMGEGGPPHVALEKIRANYPLSVHGVCMSIGGEQPIDEDHLARFAKVVERYQPALVSEHLAWSTHDNVFYNDLLPIPYTNDSLNRVCEHIIKVQEAIARPILLENPSTYVVFASSSWSETDFITEIVRRTGCRLLLDINNVFVSATNHNFSAEEYLQNFPLQHIREIHLAGHAQQKDDEGETLLIDSHDRPVADAVWRLYEDIIQRCGPLATLIEWDNEIPEWPILKSEATQANKILQHYANHGLILGEKHAINS